MGLMASIGSGKIKTRFHQPKHHKPTSKVGTYMDLGNGKLHVHRTVGQGLMKRVEKLSGTNRSAGKLDMASIKAEIESKLKAKNKGSEKIPALTASNRMHSGIPGLDEVMEGGFRRGTVNLIGGGAGSGKTIFCMQFLIEGIYKHKEPGVLISFEQTPEEIARDMKPFGWDVMKLVNENKLRILHYTPEQVEKVLEAGGGTVRDAIDSVKAKRLVLDSLTAFNLLHDNELARRKALLQLLKNIHKWNVTALMTSEQEPNPDSHKSTVMEFSVEGVILLYNIRKGDIRERSLEIYKMRGTHHSAKIFPMKIDDSGIMIYPEETVF